jgi:RHS repeat-associated protein
VGEPHPYDYDAAGRLTSALHEATGAEEKFTYDAAGSSYPAGEEREYGPGGRLRRRAGVEYEWDAAGRLVEKRERGQRWRYAWDAAGRLIGAVLPDGRRVAYTYDPLGRRVEAQYAGEVTRFVWDGDAIAHAITTRAAREGDPVVEVRTFCFEDGGFVPWAQGEEKDDGYGGRDRRWSYFANDPIGTPDVLVDGSGAVVAEIDRAAWGKVTAGREATPIRFQGQSEDAATGLFYNRYRWYDAEAGIYVSPDPIGLGGGLRAYGYGINPTGWIDPLGLAGKLVPLNAPGYSVYGITAPGASKPHYIGITNDMRRRECEHMDKGRLPPGASMEALPGSKDLTYAEARGHEQASIEHYGTKGPFPGNKRNSIDPDRNDARGQAMHQEYWKKKGDL